MEGVLDATSAVWSSEERVLGAELEFGEGIGRLADDGEQVVPELNERVRVGRGGGGRHPERPGPHAVLGCSERFEEPTPRTPCEPSLVDPRGRTPVSQCPPKDAQRGRVRDTAAKHICQQDCDRLPTAGATVAVRAEQLASPEDTVAPEGVVAAKKAVADQRAASPAMRAWRSWALDRLEFGWVANEDGSSHRDAVRTDRCRAKKLTFRTRLRAEGGRRTSPSWR